MDYLSNCPSTPRSTKSIPAIVTTATASPVSHTIREAISTMGVVNIEIRAPSSKPKRVKVDGPRKRKQLQPKKPEFKGTITGHYMISLQKTMNYMD
ncbi:hypothetical protein INT46_004376 [Mucor plumbeus]|uniref:Uncharacterized protein n=1 Tax=Mucor plumbeus TaxID=97098 RepID=A0A8H7QDH1_9FUNG|nr:hypothetical protein INT46_004376 [Mucor plumbeus]